MIINLTDLIIIINKLHILNLVYHSQKMPGWIHMIRMFVYWCFIPKNARMDTYDQNIRFFWNHDEMTKSVNNLAS